MASSMSEGYLAVKEGSLYWEYDISSQKPTPARPVLLFLHAGVTDHTLWDAQVSYFLSKGWNCLRCDRFGFGLSVPSGEYLDSDPRQPVDHVEHVKSLVNHVLDAGSKVIVVGLSMGGGLALDFTVVHPGLVAGLVVAAGGVYDAGQDNAAEEDALFAEIEKLIESGDVQAAAAMQVRIWGDGPLQPPGRMVKPLADKMLAWNLDISARQVAKTGGPAFEEAPPDPLAVKQLDKVRVPTAIAYGTFDETYTTTSMKYLAANIAGAVAKEFPVAHMINLEGETGFNEWLSGWLETNFP